MTTRDGERLAELPLYPERTGEEYIDALTRRYARRPESPTMTLRPIQALMLAQAVLGDGLVALAGCGSGKTLTTLLLPHVLGAERPLLLIPASMRAQFRSDCEFYGQHFHISPPEILSYESLSSPKQIQRLAEIAPDLIICDEAHALRNLRSARVRRLEGYLLETGARLCALSGTLVSRSLRDYAHVMNWALKAWSPLPRETSTVEKWAEVIEEGGFDRETQAEVDHALPEGRTLETRLQARLRGSRGVVISGDQRVGASLVITRRRFRPPERLRDAINALLSTQSVVSATQDILDEKALDSIFSSRELWTPEDSVYSRVWAQLALGFVYVWDWGEREEDVEWVHARRGWGSACNAVLTSGVYDSEALLKRDIEAGRYTRPRAVDALRAWRDVERRPPPQTRAIWVDESWANDVAEWAHSQKDPPILWVQFGAVAQKLAELTGFEMYGSGAENSARLNAQKDTAHPCIMSISAHATGKNLQAWRNQIVAHPLSHPATWEQMVARTHRSGQTADVVNVTRYNCGLFGRAWRRARDDARYIYETTGAEQRILYADQKND